VDGSYNTTGQTAGGKLLHFLKPLRVDLREVLPLLRHSTLLKNSIYWAGWLTCTTVNALVRVDIKHLGLVETLFAGSRMNAIHGTYINAGGILDTNARLRDDIGHVLFTSLDNREIPDCLGEQKARASAPVFLDKAALLQKI
jgi:hypothetical protein